MVREDLGDEIVDKLFAAIEANKGAVSISDLEAAIEEINPDDIPQEYHWTAAMTVADTSVNYMVVDRFAKLMNEKTGGKVTIDLYPSGQLGNTTEFTEAVIGGSIDFGTGMTTDLVDFIPQYGIFDMPNLFNNVSEMRSVLSGDFVAYLNNYCNQGGLQMLGYSDAGFRQLTTNKVVHTLEDLKGQKIRVMTNKYHISYWNALGAAATPMQFTEVFMGLQQGTIDGEENPYMNIVGNNVQEVQKYIVETNHIGHVITFFMNNELYQSLPENLRNLVDACAHAATAYGNSMADESIAAYKRVCEDAGCEIIFLEEEVLEEIRGKAQVVYDMVRDDLGDELVDTMMNAIQEVREAA
ncbi:MAG: TRAP transporter substrate-binding protein [Blautia sp.]|nr:TRAP transporter substrate-binding protein [Blautia sp.]